MPQNKTTLTPNAETVCQERIYLKNKKGQVIETPEKLFRRVAKFIAKPERNKKWEKKFFEILNDLRFLPNSPTLVNAGKKDAQLSACFVLPVEDNLAKIFESLKNAAITHQTGGGTGFSFSRLRSHGSEVHSSHGVAGGPVAFMKIFDQATEAIKQGGVRRGANMGVLSVEHPDILEFIEAKKSLQHLTNFNISVAITDSFMRALKAKKTFSLKDPHSHKIIRTLSAQKIWDTICESAWTCGDPGLIFIDEVNRKNPTPRLGRIEATNPCGEQPLLPNESCNLGSLNLVSYFVSIDRGEGRVHKDFNWQKLDEDIETAVRFLDNVITLNHFPTSENKEITFRNRKIGLGVMGFGDLLVLMRIPYDSEAARTLGEKIMKFLTERAREVSHELAREKGAFPEWSHSLWKKKGMKKLRNATLTTVAPTGTISIIAGVSSGIEPIFSSVYYRNILSGKQLVEVHPVLKEILRQKGLLNKNEICLSEKEINKILKQELGDVWKSAKDIAPEDHVRMQAVFQKHCDSGVSKTINMSHSTTPAEISKAYLLAYELKCKGITIYRDGCRPVQVLQNLQDVETCLLCD